MQQVHRRFTTEQVKALLQQYDQGHMTRKDVQELLAIGKTRFFALLADYRQDASAFSVSYERTSHRRLAATTEEALQRELLEEKALVADKTLPISGYNYSAVRDNLSKQGLALSLFCATVMTTFPFFCPVSTYL